MTYPDLRILMFAYHTEKITRVVMEAAIHLWQRSNGFKPVEFTPVGWSRGK